MVENRAHEHKAHDMSFLFIWFVLVCSFHSLPERNTRYIHLHAEKFVGETWL